MPWSLNATIVERRQPRSNRVITRTDVYKGKRTSKKGRKKARKKNRNIDEEKYEKKRK